MKKVAVVLLLALCMPLFTVNAQDCSDRIRSANKLYDQYKSTKDVKYLDAARTLLTNIVNTPSNPDKCRKVAANMLRSFNSSTPAPTTASTSSSSSSSGSRGSSRVVYNQQSSSDFIYGSEVIFDSDGGNCSEVRVTCKSWFAQPNDNCDWLTISDNGNYLIVNCAPNPNPGKRSCSISIICSDESGTSIGKVVVEQKGNRGNSKESGLASEGSMVKITIESGKTTPVFENVGSILKLLDENKNKGLQIEVPLCKNQTWFKNLFAPLVVNKRIKKITNYFVAAGINKDRISKNVIWVEKGKTGVDCDCAYAKIIDLPTETQK